MSEIGLTPKDNELRMQVGFRLTHEAEHRLYVADKDGNWMCPMEALKELLALVRDDERAKCAADYLQDCCDAIDAARLEEREACLAIVETHPTARVMSIAIKARGNE